MDNLPNNVINAYAVSELERWFKAHEEYFEKTGAVRYKDSGMGSATVRIETKKYLIDISAWDHATCLDIQILEIETAASTFPHVGDCETKSEFLKRLNLLTEWFDNAAF
jgi:hypothetical protein